MAIAQKAAVIFESVKGENKERVYQFVIPVGSPYGEVFDVVFEMMAASEQYTKQAIENAKKAIEEAKAKEDKTQEVTAEIVK